jgi:hypothetical protein
MRFLFVFFGGGAYTARFFWKGPSLLLRSACALPKKTGCDDWALVRQLPFLGPWALQQLSVPAQHRFQLWKLHGLLSMPEQLTTTALSGSRSNN